MKTTNKKNQMTLTATYYYEGALIPMRDRDQLIGMLNFQEILDLEWIELQAKVQFVRDKDTALYTDKVGDKLLSLELSVPRTWSPKHGTPITPETEYHVTDDTQGIFNDLPDCFDLAAELDEALNR